MSDRARLDRETLCEHITCWDEFVTQASDAAIKTYGVEYNNWALYIPALMAELNNSIAHDVNTRVYDNKQLELGLEPEQESVESDDETELSVATRLKQLSESMNKPADPTKHRVMDPFRKMEQDKQFKQASDTPDQSVWDLDPDWNE